MCVQSVNENMARPTSPKRQNSQCKNTPTNFETVRQVMSFSKAAHRERPSSDQNHQHHHSAAVLWTTCVIMSLYCPWSACLPHCIPCLWLLGPVQNNTLPKSTQASRILEGNIAATVAWNTLGGCACATLRLETKEFDLNCRCFQMTDNASSLARLC